MPITAVIFGFMNTHELLFVQKKVNPRVLWNWRDRPWHGTCCLRIRSNAPYL